VDVDEVVVEVDVVPLQGLEFAGAEAGVERGCVERAVAGLEGVEEGAELGWGGDPVAPSTDWGQGEREVDGDEAAVVGAAVDRAQRQEGVAGGARGEPLGGELAGEVLERREGDRGQSFAAQVGEGAFQARLLTRGEIEEAFAELNSSGEVSGVTLRFVERDVGVIAVFEPSAWG
jgi:hypothetical protein